MNIKLKIKFNLKFLIKYLYFIIIILFTISLFIIISFLYKNFYQTILSSGEIIILKQQIAPESFDINKFNQIIKEIEAKQNATTTNWAEFKNIFKEKRRLTELPPNAATSTLSR